MNETDGNTLKWNVGSSVQIFCPLSGRRRKNSPPRLRSRYERDLLLRDGSRSLGIVPRKPNRVDKSLQSILSLFFCTLFSFSRCNTDTFIIITIVRCLKTFCRKEAGKINTVCASDPVSSLNLAANEGIELYFALILPYFLIRTTCAVRNGDFSLGNI